MAAHTHTLCTVELVLCCCARRFAIIDRRMLCNGSFNWTRQAVLANQENCVVTDHGGLVRDFGTQFEALWNKYTARR